MLNLITFNRWWDTNKVPEVYLKPYKRPLFYDLKKFLDKRQILLIYGLRRVGKSTLMYQLIDLLLKNEVNKKHILYFSFDEKAASLKEILENYSEIVLNKDLLEEKQLYLFLDEIQKLDDWQNQLKMAYDLYPNIKFIVSGSASLVISKGAKESLAGRVFEFVLPLLSFKEYLNLCNEEVAINNVKNIFDIKELKNIYLKKARIAPLLAPYIKKGGFIEITPEKDDFAIKEYSKSLLERVIFSDIPNTFNIREPQLLKTILELVASNPGFLLDYSKIADTLNRDQRSIADYVFYLKYSLLAKTIYNFSGSGFVSERKLKKIYLSSTNFIYQTQGNRFAEPAFLGRVMENLIVSFEKSNFFWRRRQKEVDLVLEDNVPLEVKYKKRITKQDLNPVIKFCQKFKADKGIILSKDTLEVKRIKGIELLIVPVWIYLLHSE